MTEYVLAPSLEGAHRLASALWDVVRPQHLRDPNDVTTEVAHIVVHPGLPPHESLAGLVRVRVERDHPLHAEADANAFDALLQPYVDAGAVTPAELVAIQTAIENGRGGAADMLAALPAVFAATVESAEALDAEGWFAVAS